MTEDPSDDALAHLLGEPEAETRDRFEERLAHDPSAAALLKDCTDTLAQFAFAAAPEQMPAAGERRAMWAAILSTALPPPARPRPSGRGHWFWPLAAAALLALNLAQWAWRTPMPSGVAAPKEETAPKPAMPPIASAASPEADSSPVFATELIGGETRALGRRSGSGHLSRAALVSPGVAIASIAGEPALADFTAAPALSVATLGSGGGIATDPGTNSFTTTTFSSTGGATSSITITSGVRGGLSRVTATFPYGLSAPATTFFPAGTYSRVSLPVPIPPAPRPAAARPAFGRSFFTAAEDQGYLDLYNLPEVPADQLLQLWVEPAGSETYQPVGEIPAEFYGGSGSVDFKLPADSLRPAKILITIEPRTSDLAAPTGPVVLHSP